MSQIPLFVKFLAFSFLFDSNCVVFETVENKTEISRTLESLEQALLLKQEKNCPVECAVLSLSVWPIEFQNKPKEADTAKIQTESKFKFQKEFLHSDPFKKFHSLGYPILIDFASAQRLKNKPVSLKLPFAAKYSSHCENQLLLVNKQIPLDLDDLQVLFQFQQKNRHFFIGNNWTILEPLAAEKLIQNLHYKIFLPSRTTVSEDVITKFLDLKRQNSLQNAHIRVAISNIKFYHHKSTETGKKIGLMPEFLRCLKKTHNTTYDLNLDEEWNLTHNDSASNTSRGRGWTGALDKLAQGELDMVFAATPSLIRVKYFEASPCVLEHRFIFITRGPRPIERNWNSWASAFSPLPARLWLLIVFAILTMIWVIYLSLKVKVQNRSFCITLPFSAIILDIWAPFFSQSVGGLKKLESARGQSPGQNEGQSQGQSHKHFFGLLTMTSRGRVKALLVLWIFTAMFLSNFYTVDLLSAITAPKMEKRPSDVSELANDPTYRIYSNYISGGIEISFWRETRHPALVNIRERKIDIEYNQTINCVLSAVVEPKTACLVFHLILSSLIATNLSLVNIQIPLKTSPSFFSINSGPLFPRFSGSPFVSDLQDALVHMRDMGILLKSLADVQADQRQAGRRWFQSEEGRQSMSYKKLGQIFHQDQAQYRHDEVKVHALKKEAFISPFVILISGCLLALVRFLREIYSKIKNQ